jgi:hypothetical protein
VLLFVLACAGADTSVIDGPTPAETASDTAYSSPCGAFGPASAPQPAAGYVLRADGLPVRLDLEPGFTRVALDPLGAARVAVYYDGGNAVTAVLGDRVKKVVGCEERGTWDACPALTTRSFDVPAGAALQLELSGEATPQVWLVATDAAAAPGPCGG